MPRRSLSHSDGFTLVELLIVLAIIGVLVSVSMAIYRGARIRAAEASAISTLHAVNQAQFAVYYAGMGMGNVKAYNYMPKEIIDFAITSPANLKVTLRISIPWWAKNTDDVQKRWLAFLG